MQHVHNVLPDYVNGKLDDELSETVSLHLSKCVDCQAEAELLRGAFNEVRLTKQDVPPRYFNSIVPRLQQRLERQKLIPWFQNALLGRIVWPVAAATLIIALLMQLQFKQVADSGLSLVSSQETFTSEEVAEALAQQTEPLPLSNLDVQEVAESTLSATVLEQQIAENILTNDVEFGTDDFLGVLNDQLLDGLSEQEVETLLQRLGERM